MIKQRKIELLAPAKNLECGIAAIDHGADAVYIGAPKFGARAAAVNSLEDIAALVEYAHLLAQRLRGVERKNVLGTSMQVIMGKAPAETLVELRVKGITATPGRGTRVLFAAGKDGIQLPAIGSRHILYIRDILRSSLYLERRGTGIEQCFQFVTLIEVFE